MISVIHCPSRRLKCHISPLFLASFFLVPVHQNARRKRERLLQGKWAALFIFLSLYASAGCRYRAWERRLILWGADASESRREEEEGVHFFLSGAWHVKRVMIYTSVASARAPAYTYPHTRTHIEETPPVWVLESKQTLMSHLSVSLTMFCCWGTSSSSSTATVRAAWPRQPRCVRFSQSDCGGSHTSLSHIFSYGRSIEGSGARYSL